MAFRTYSRAVTVAAQTARAPDGDEAARRRDELAARITQIALRVPREAPPDMVLTWDGASWPRRSWSEPMAVDAGTHRLAVSAPGYAPSTMAVIVAAPGQTVPVDVPLLRAEVVQRPASSMPAPDPAADSPPRRGSAASAASMPAPDKAPAADSGSTTGDEPWPLWWLEGSLGVGTADIEAISYASAASGQNNTPGGAVFSAAGGVNFGAIRAGLRTRNLGLSGLNVWEWGGDLAVQARVQQFLLYLGVRGGYAAATLSNSGAGPQATAAPTESNGDGFDVGLMVGLDYSLTSAVSLGFDLNPELLDLHRPPLPLPAGVTPAMLSPEVQALQSESGVVVGAVFAGTAHLAVHF